jgi:hypothetical protein
MYVLNFWYQFSSFKLFVTTFLQSSSNIKHEWHIVIQHSVRHKVHMYIHMYTYMYICIYVPITTFANTSPNIKYKWHMLFNIIQRFCSTQSTYVLMYTHTCPWKLLQIHPAVTKTLSFVIWMIDKSYKSISIFGGGGHKCIVWLNFAQQKDCFVKPLTYLAFFVIHCVRLTRLPYHNCLLFAITIVLTLK